MNDEDTAIWQSTSLNSVADGIGKSFWLINN